jgi:ferritin-like metal-binding protein YciE
MKTLQDLFLDSLADLHYAEKQLVKALPKMAKAASDAELRTAFESHLEETRHHVEIVESVFSAFGQEPKTKKCPAILGIIKEAEELISENKKSPTIDAALIFAGQKAEHYEIASYGGLREWAGLLGNKEAARLIDEILEEEKAADAKLNRLAQERCNGSANQGGIEKSSRQATVAVVA